MVQRYAAKHEHSTRYKVWYLIHHDSFSQNATEILLQNASGFLLQNTTALLQNVAVNTKCDDFITICNSYYKMQRLLQVATVHGANQRNALIRLKWFLSSEAKKVLVNNYFYSNFNYCPLVWMCSSAKSLNKIGSPQKRALRYLYSDYESPYDTLLAKSGKVTMKASRLKSLCVEIYKSINSINPSFYERIF